MGRVQAAIDRYEAKVDRSGECHLWTAFCNPGGYGMFWGGKRRPGGQPIILLAHRWGYEHFVGPIPEGDVVLHSCDTPSCQNPEHWVLGSQADNVEDMVAKGRNASKLTPTQVREARRRSAQGETATSIARDLGVTNSTISYLLRGDTWSHV